MITRGKQIAPQLLLLVALVTGAAAPPAQAASLAAHDAPTVSAVTTTEAAGRWVLYDGNLITTRANCEARVRALKREYPENFTCRSIRVAACPEPRTYWQVWIYKEGPAPVRVDPAAASC